MNIHSEEGSKVEYLGIGGYDSHLEHANKYLTIGTKYTVEYTEVSGWHTDVYLKEHEDVAFNSVHFKNVK